MPKQTPSHDPIGSYLREVQRNLSSGIAREQTHRRALEDLLESLDPTIDAFNDPKHIDVGAPDFTIRRKGNAIDFPVGYVETKDIGDDLDKTEKSEQMKRYLGLPSVLLTDYLEFLWYTDGKIRPDPPSAKKAALPYLGEPETVFAFPLPRQAVALQYSRSAYESQNSPTFESKTQEYKTAILKCGAGILFANLTVH